MNVSEQKIKLFFDIDDTILESSKAVIDILNKKYNMSKTIDDLRDWKYRSIYPFMNDEMIKDLFDSEEFFETVKVNDAFMRFYQENCNKFEWYFVTKGYQKNIERKEEMIGKYFPMAKLIPLVFYGNEEGSYDKSSVDMDFGIQIDDRYDSLSKTNANCKILLTHGKDRKYNRFPPAVENLYVVNEMSDVIDIINFAYNDKEVFMNKLR